MKLQNEGIPGIVYTEHISLLIIVDISPCRRRHLPRMHRSIFIINKINMLLQNLLYILYHLPSLLSLEMIPLLMTLQRCTMKRNNAWFQPQVREIKHDDLLHLEKDRKFS
jgi:hypothetical protein